MSRNVRRLKNAFLSCGLLMCLSGWAAAQTPAPSLRGQVLDPSGAAVPALNVILTGPTGNKLTVQTDVQGNYAFRNLPPGSYTLTIQLQGFENFVKAGIPIAKGSPQVVNAQLAVAVAKQQITVTDSSTQVAVNPEENASALVLKGKDLESLSDDPDELQSELEALAGPSAGPNGGQIYIDGFTGGQLPPKSSIREIRVNQNPFSAQYDSLGYGRIEILTKPGTDKLHGQVFVTGNDQAFNTRNPFAGNIPGYHSEMFNGNVGGPLSKKTSFYFDAQRRDIEDDGIVNATILDSNFNPVPQVQAVPTPQVQTSFSPRIDTQIGNNNTLTLRYQLWDNTRDNPNVGQLTLPTQAYNSSERWQSIQVSDAQVINDKAVTEIRFRYGHDSENINPVSAQPSLVVVGAFSGGGYSGGTTGYVSKSYELQDYTSVTFKKHFVKFGARFRDYPEASSSTSGFNGIFTFPSIQAYQITQQGINAGLTPAQIQANGGGPSQFTLTTGNPATSISYFDLEPYVEDDWKAMPNMTVSAGLRFETQDHIRDHADFAPRVGVAWGLGRGKTPKSVLRAGMGVFYDRFSESYIINAARLNGLNQQQYIVPSPLFFPDIPPINTLSASLASPNIYQIAPNLRTPYTIQSGIGLERQLGRSATVSATYLNTHGQHQLITRDINAPYIENPGGARPNPNIADIYQYESAGLYNQNQLIANFNLRGGAKFSFFGFYTLSYADSNTAGGGSFPMNQYDLAQDYGRAAYDVRHRIFLGGNWNLPHGFQLFPFVVVNSAPPFNITLSQDYTLGNAVSGAYLPVFNARPAFAPLQATGPNIVSTPWGRFDTDPVAGENIIPPDYGTGFGQFVANLRLSKTFGFGREIQGAGSGGGGGGGGHGHGLGGGGLSSMNMGGMFGRGGAVTNRRFNLTFSISARNIFNDVNYASPIGSLSSPNFGKAINLAGGFYSSNAANRRIDLQVRLTF